MKMRKQFLNNHTIASITFVLSDTQVLFVNACNTVTYIYE